MYGNYPHNLHAHQSRQDDRLMIVPWDYDHALGCTGVASGENSWTEYINTPIDEPTINVTMAERPLINCLLSDETYLSQYRAYLDEFITAYIDSGRLEETTDRIVSMIRPYVESDPTSGVSMEDFRLAVQSDLDFCRLRTESVRGQLAGTIPATMQGQTDAPETLVNCDGFVSPDSGSLTELLLPEGSGLYFEDLVRTLTAQLNPFATVSIMPIEDIVNIVQSGEHGSGGNGLVQRVQKAGLIQNYVEFEDSAKTLVLGFLSDIATYIAVPIVLIAALVFAFRYKEKRKPAARKRGNTHAV